MIPGLGRSEVVIIYPDEYTNLGGQVIDGMMEIGN